MVRHLRLGLLFQGSKCVFEFLDLMIKILLNGIKKAVALLFVISTKEIGIA